MGPRRPQVRLQSDPRPLEVPDLGCRRKEQRASDRQREAVNGDEKEKEDADESLCSGGIDMGLVVLPPLTGLASHITVSEPQFPSLSGAIIRVPKR